MQQQYMDVSAKPAAGGIDSYSSRAKIGEDHVEDALNMNVDASGRWSKRAGYEASMGWLPLRARRFIQDGTSIRIHFDSAQVVNLSTAEIGPVIMYGKLPQLADYGTSSYATPSTIYFDTFNLINKDTLSVGTNTINKSAADTGVASKYVYVGLAQALSGGNDSNDTVMPGLVQINTSTFAISVEYTASVQASAYFFYKEKTPAAGSVYTTTWVAGTSMTISAATHALSNSRIAVKVFSEAAGVATEAIPELVSINESGDVTITLTASITGFIVLSTVPLANYYTSAAVAGVNTFTIASPPSALCFYYIYYYSAGNRISVVPSLINYNSTTDATTITYELAVGSETVEIYYEDADSVSNIIELTDTGSATIDTTEGSFVVWGVGHEDTYTASAVKGGWVHHVDTYKSVGDSHLVAGVNGCLYWQAPFADAPSSFLLERSFTSLNARIQSEQIIGPLFVTASMSRTRGNVIDASVVSGMAVCTGAAYQSSGISHITLSFTGKTGNIAGSIGTNDVFTVSGMSNAKNNGSFRFLSVVTEDAVSAVLSISNASATDATMNETGSLGGAGVFTDGLTFSAYHRFIPGDVLFAEGASEYTMVATSATDGVLVQGVLTPTTFSANLLVTGSRKGRVLPLRLADNVVSVRNFVRGDSLYISGVTQKPVVINAHPGADVTATAVTASGITTITLSAARTFNQGQYISIFGDTTDVYNGEFAVLAAPNTTTITLSTPLVGDGAGAFRVLGKCLSLNQSVSWGDDFSASPVNPDGRWLPIEAPSRNGSLVIADTSPLLFSSNEYADQPNVKSVVVSDSMFFGNGDDRVFKYDGSAVVQAGLSRTIPSVFMSFDNSVPSILKGFETAYSASSVLGKSFTIAVNAFVIGDRVLDSVTGGIFVITDRQQDLAANTWKLVVAGDTSGLTGAGTLTAVKRFRYYVVYKLIDRNGNINSTNAANSSDMYFDLTASGRIRIKTSYYLPSSFQNFERMEVELYRTLANSLAPFYLTKRLSVDFSYSSLTSLEFIDDNDDAFLTQPDSTASALLQTEIGRGWQPPLRAKAVTTLDNRLLIANLKGWPKFDVTFKPSGVSATIANFDGITLLFRKDNTDTSTTPDFLNRVKFQFENAGSYGLSKPASFTFLPGDVNIGTDAIVVTGKVATQGGVGGDAMRFSTTGTLPAPLVAGTTYYGSSDFSFGTITIVVFATKADALAGTNRINLTTTGSGTHTFSGAGEIWDGIITRGADYTTGDWIYLFYDAAQTLPINLALCGWFQITKNADDTATILGWGRGTQTFGDNIPDTISWVGGAIPVWVGADFAYNQVNGNTSGSVELIAARRLADAINFVMSYSQYLNKQTNPTFQPWLTAYAGSDYGVGQCVIETQTPIRTTPELRLGTIPSALNIFVNNLARDTDEEIGASTLLFPSRVGLSYRNYPEIFDNLEGDRGTSDSVVDVNPADGQFITAIIPFFGESMFGGASLNQVALVFKESSVYVLDTTTREYQKLDSRGVGAIAPASITAARDSVMFASRGSIYRVTRQMTIQNVGKMLTGPRGLWGSHVNIDTLDVAAATHWGQERRYILSFPAKGGVGNSGAFVMQYDREDDGLPPAWSRYDNIPATLYANFGANNYFGSTEGIVFRTSVYGEAVDFADDVAAISSSITFRAEDFGLPGVRKSIPGILVQFDTPFGNVTDVTVKSGIGLSETFDTLGVIDVDADASPVIRCSVDKKKSTHIQVKITHSNPLEAFSIVGVSYRVGRMDSSGVPQTTDFK